MTKKYNKKNKKNRCPKPEEVRKPPPGPGYVRIELHVADQDDIFTFCVNPSRMARVCPSWTKLRMESSDDVIKAPWQDGAAEFALNILFNRIHHQDEVFRRLQAATARQLFYVGEVYEWLGRPQSLSPKRISDRENPGKYCMPSDGIQKAVDGLVKKAGRLYNISDWVLLGAVAARFELPDLKTEVRRNVILSFEQSHFDGQNLPFHITPEQWTALVESRIILPSDRDRRLARIGHIFKCIELLVEQSASHEAGLLPNTKRFHLQNDLNIVPCSNCQVVSVGRLTRELASEGLWPVGDAKHYHQSVSNLLLSLKNAESRIRLIADFRDEDEEVWVGMFACNTLYHMYNRLLEVMRKTRNGGIVGEIGNVDHEINDLDLQMKNAQACWH